MIPLEVTMTVAAGGPSFCFVVSMKSLMTLVKSVDDGLRVRESETQLNLNRPLRISADPMHNNKHTHINYVDRKLRLISFN